jgi:Fic family protein
VFEPVYSITPLIAKLLMQISGLKQDIDLAPITPTMLAHLRATARMSTIHYSTKIEGNRLTLDQVKELIKKGGTVGRKRDENEVLGYYAALDEIDVLAKKKGIHQKDIKKIHAIVMNGGKKKIKMTPYRDGQNVVKDGATGNIVYLPPEAQDVEKLMQDLIDWINDGPNHDIPVPLIAGIAHYQFVTIHPYYDGNGRTARLLATLILHQGGYDLKGIYCLEEYYAKDLADYYRVLDVGPSHNYYMGRAESDITSWVEYFCRSMLKSFESVKRRTLGNLKRNKNIAKEMRYLDARKRALLTLFVHESEISAQDVQHFFNIKPRTARHLCKQWVEDKFLVIVHPSKKLRTYTLVEEYKRLI